MKNIFDSNEQEIIATAVNQLSSVCDNAASRDSIGFNRSDSYIGNHLAILPIEQWTETEYVYCWTILFKYRNQLEQLFNTSINDIYTRKLNERKKDKISDQLKIIHDKIKNKVNTKDILIYDKKLSQFTLIKNHIKHSANFLSALDFINAKIQINDTSTEWYIESKYSEAIKYIIDKYIGSGHVNYVNQARQKLRLKSPDKLSLHNLLNEGLDQNNIINIDSVDNFGINITIKSASNYKLFSKLSRYNYKKESFCATAKIVIDNDYRLILQAVQKKDFKLNFEKSEINILQLKKLHRENQIGSNYFEPSITNEGLILNDENKLLNHDYFSSNDIIINKEERSITLKPASKRAFKFLILFLRKINKNLTPNEYKFLNEFTKSNKTKKANIIIHDKKKNLIKISIKYNEKVVKEIKKIPYSERDFDEETKVWLIHDAIKNFHLIKTIKKIINFEFNEITQ